MDLSISKTKYLPGAESIIYVILRCNAEGWETGEGRCTADHSVQAS